MTMFPVDRYNQAVWIAQPLQEIRPLVNTNFPNFGDRTAAIQGAVEQSARHWLQTQLCVGSNPAQPVLNPLRTYLFNQMSNNNYANPDWASYVSSVGQAVELLTVGLGQDLTQSIANMVSEVGRFYIYRAVAKDPGLAAIVNQQQMLELNQIAQNGNALATKIEEFQQHRARQIGVAPQMQPNGQNQWGRGTAPGQFGGYNQAVQPTGGFQFGNLSPQTVMVTPQQPAFQQPTIGSKDIRVSGASVLGQIETQPMVAQQLAPQPVQQPNHNFQPITPNGNVVKQTNDDWMSVTFSPTGKTEIVGSNPAQNQTFDFAPPPNIDYQYNTQQGVSAPTANDLNIQDVTPVAAPAPVEHLPEIQPVVMASSQLTYIGSVAAYTNDFIHEPLICLATHRIVGDKVMELPEMHYNEIEVDQSKHQEVDKGRHIPIYRQTAEDEVEASEPTGVVDFSNPILVPELLTAVNSTQAINTLKYTKDIYVKGTVMEFTNLNPKPVLLVSREQFGKQCAGLFVGSQETDVTKLKTLVGETLIHSKLLFDELDYRGTEAINKALAVSMGLDNLHIDSFYDDWDSLIAALVKRGKPTLDAFTTQLGSIVHAVACLAPPELEQYLLDVTFDQMTGAELSGIRINEEATGLSYDTPQQMGNRRKALRADKERKDIVTSAVVLLDVEYNAVISTTEEDLCLNTPDHESVVVLTKDLCEPLYNYVVEVFKRMTANSSQLHYNRVILSTYEGVRFEVVLSAYSEQDLYCLYRC